MFYFLDCLTRDQTYSPCIGRQSLNHLTAREVPTVRVCVCVLIAAPASSFPLSSPLLGPPYPLRHKNIEIRSVNNPTMASTCSMERKNHTSL